MKSKRAFILDAEGLPGQYGIGKFVKTVYYEAQKNEGFQFIFIKRIESINKLSISTNDNIVEVLIPFPENSNKAWSHIESLGLLCLLDEEFNFAKEDVFHINDNSQFPLIRNIKKFFPCKIIYSIHVLLWQIFYNNDYALFSLNWASRSTNVGNPYLNKINEEAQICKIVDFVVVLNEETQKFVKKVYNISNEKVKLIPNGVPEANHRQSVEAVIALKEKLNILPQEKIILFVGRIGTQKGVDHLIDCVIGLIKKGNKIKLLLAGNGEIDKMIELTYGYWKNIIFVGYVPSDKIFDFYFLADMVVSPTQSEQSSFTILEAMSCKKPIIVSDIPAFDFLCNEVSAMKFKRESNEHDLERQIMRLLEDASLRDEIAGNAYKIFMKRFTSSIMFKKLVKIY